MARCFSLAIPPQNGSLAGAPGSGKFTEGRWADIDVPVALRAWAPSPGASGALTSLSPDPHPILKVLKSRSTRVRSGLWSAVFVVAGPVGRFDLYIQYRKSDGVNRTSKMDLFDGCFVGFTEICRGWGA